MKVQEVAVGNFIPHPATVVAVNLTTIRTDSGDHFTTTAIRACFSYTNLHYTHCVSHVLWCSNYQLHHVLSVLRCAGSVKNQQQSDDSESIVLNVAGRLLMFQRDRSLPQLKHKDKHKDRPVRASCSTHSRSFHLACLPFVEQLQLLFTVKS